MICDKEGYSGIAGVMGGEFSEITGDTVNVFLESAYFDPVAIRKNSKKLGLITDASQRFEKGVDINNVVYASDRAAQLMHELAGGEISKGLYDIYPEPFKPLKVGIRASKASEVVGYDFTKDEIISLLNKIEIAYSGEENGQIIFHIPEFRRYDLEREIDLVEEAARMYGYERFEDEPVARLNLNADTSYGDKTKQIDKVREYFIGRGFNEILTRSQQEERLVQYFSQDYVKVENPYSIESNVMRVNLMYGMLTVIRNNINTSGKDISLKLFEIGKVFSQSGKDISENNNICFALAGKRDLYSFDEPEKDFDIFDIKGELQMFLSKLNLENYGLFYYNSDIPNSSAAIGIRLNNHEVGKLYRVGKELLEIFDLDTNVYLCEMNLDKVINNIKHGIYYSEISRFPNVKRDLALLISKDVAFDDIRDVILKNGSNMLKNIRLFDIYTDKKIGEDKKSLAFSLEFSSTEKTLTDEEVNKQVGKIVKSLETKLGATLRS
jgi:phenylalanyl-tRNA synthetase beta chain